ncbi:MAG: 1-acyl-sn-glycerol-3-phosphate acyltransferase epsilon, variant 2 [Marteilia pararefringens]
MISNHVSYYDWIHIVILFRSLKAQGSCLFLVTSDVQNIPMFGIYSFLKHQCFLERKYEKDRATLNRYFNYIDPFNINRLVIFVEGNIMFERTWKYRNKILSEKNLPIFHNLMSPKFGGLKLLLDNFDFLDPENQNRPIIFLTIQHPSNFPLMPQDLLTTSKYKIFVDIEVNRKEEIFGKSSVPSQENSSQIEDGLNHKWHIMDKNIGEFKNSFEKKEKEYVKIIGCDRSIFVSMALHFANFLMIIKLCMVFRPLSILLYLLLCIFCQTLIINLYKYL